jgi:D-arabinose 1-dehydrogenase-like Zn-dependent alcohol dehydrogenase
VTESLKAVNIGGLVTIIGWIGGPGETGPSFPQILSSMAVVRGIVVGSRDQFETMVRTLAMDFLLWAAFASFQLSGY